MANRDRRRLLGGGGYPEGATFARGPASNANVIPYQLNTTTLNRYQTSRKRMQIPDDADRTDFTLELPNFVAKFNGAPYEQDGPIATFSASLEVDGVTYPFLWGGNPTISDATGGSLLVSDVLAVTATKGSAVYQNVFVTGPMVTTQYPSSQVLNATWGEYLFQSMADTTDYAQNYAKGATATCTVSGGNITACSRVNAGTGYTASAEVWAYELQADGTSAEKQIGSVTVSAGGITNTFTISSGTPPAGKTWTNPIIMINYGMTGFSNSLASRGFTGILKAVPVSRPVVYALVDGTSLDRGNGLSLKQDLKQNQGAMELGIANRCAVFNVAIGSGILQNMSDIAGKYPKMYAAIASSGCTHAIIGGPTNDLNTNNRTKAQFQGYLTTIADALRSPAYGSMKVSFGTIPARTTSTDAWATTANQTAVAASTAGAFTTGGMADLLNDDVMSGAFASDNNPIDYRFVHNVIGGTTGIDPVWIPSTTTDGVHPNLSALALLANNTAYKAQYNFLGLAA